MSNPVVNTFNTQLINLAEALSDRFKDDGDLKLALTGIKTLKANNSNKNIEMFTLYVYKYRDKIMEKNEKLLLETDFVSENLDEDDDNSAFDIMSKLKTKWQSLNDEEKSNIWKYLQVLIKLTDKHIQNTLGK
tara:strand:+ start:137 stop:535 length:399 start_codon:yes stop_codon:yes gene_type:complete